MPAIRSDIVDIYIFRRAESAQSADAAIELLQLHRAPRRRTGRSEPDLLNIPPWHPVMGHIADGERATDCALRELTEEVGLRSGDPHLLGLWSLEQVHPYFVPQWDAIIMSPRFAAEVTREWEPTLNAEHSRFRWVQAHQARRYFTWPGQLAAVREITGELLRHGSPLPRALRISLNPPDDQAAEKVRNTVAPRPG